MISPVNNGIFFCWARKQKSSAKRKNKNFKYRLIFQNSKIIAELKSIKLFFCEIIAL